MRILYFVSAMSGSNVNKRVQLFTIYLVFLIAGFAGIECRQTDTSLPKSPQSQAQESLKQWFKIKWEKMPNLPRGFQDSDGGIIDNTLITTCGFCSGQSDVPGKPNKYPRGFMRNTWGLDLTNPEKGWQVLPQFPGCARQENFAIVVNNELYTWGGFSYTSPYCYKDGYQLSHRDDKWTWSTLPELPWCVCSSGICALGSKIYAFGGADYDEVRFYTNGDRAGNISHLGGRLLVIDTEYLKAGWKELSPCPGTPRWIPAMAAVNGKIYVVGGAAGSDNVTGTYCTVVDNWCYDPVSDKWHRLRDLPVSSGNFPSGQIVYKDRYILLIGGYQYSNILNADNTIRQPYGKPFAHYKEKAYYSDIFVYDTKDDLFGTATPLPLNNNLPMTVVEGNQLHLIGGEIDGAVIEGEPFGHHPDLYLRGLISESGS